MSIYILRYYITTIMNQMFKGHLFQVSTRDARIAHAPIGIIVTILTVMNVSNIKYVVHANYCI